MSEMVKVCIYLTVIHRSNYTLNKTGRLKEKDDVTLSIIQALEFVK